MSASNPDSPERQTPPHSGSEVEASTPGTGTDDTAVDNGDTDGTGDAGEALSCGRQVDDIIEQVADGRAGELGAHQQGCTQCQAALREFGDVWAPITAAAGVPVIVPDDFNASVMRQVRDLVKNTWYTLELTDGGSVRVAARVVATIARDAARRVPGVLVAFGRSSESKMAQLVEKATLGHLSTNAAVGVLGRTAIVDLAVTMSYGDVALTVAEQVQRTVIDELGGGVGLKNVQVNVTVDDVRLPPRAS